MELGFVQILQLSEPVGYFRDHSRAGYARTKDINGYQQDGFGVDDMTISKSKRCSAAHAYLHPIRSRKNLEVVTDALVDKVIVEGNRAAGVSYTRDGASASATAAREVILSAGAINTPQVLMLSGIGPPELLTEYGITVTNPLPGVGGNLMDHVAVTVQHECLQPVSRQAAVRPLGRLKAGVQWLLFKSGDAATNQFEASGYVRSKAGIRQPDLQIDFIPFALTLTKCVEPVAHGFQTHATIMRSPSRGWVRLASADPREPPRILCNYLSSEEDFVQLRAGIRLVREIHAQPAFHRYRGPERRPGLERTEDSELEHDASVLQRVPRYSAMRMTTA